MEKIVRTRGLKWDLASLAEIERDDSLEDSAGINGLAEAALLKAAH